MCGLFASTTGPEDIVGTFGVGQWDPTETVAPSWNVAPTQAVHVVLEPVEDARLDHPPVRLEVVEEDVEAIEDLLLPLHGRHARGDDACEEDAARAGRRIGREPQLPERDAPSGRERTGVPDLQLGDEHVRRLRTGGRNAHPGDGVWA